MKYSLPHLFYLSVLLAGSIFYWRTQRHDRQLLDFVNRPSDEAYLVLRQVNEQLKEHITEQAEVYPNPYSQTVARFSLQADSLVKMPWNQHFSAVDLRRQLAALDEQAGSDKLLEAYLPSHSFPGRSATTVALLAQNDSLRRQIALALVFSHLSERVTGIIDRFDSFMPVASFTSLCAPTHQSTATDICLSSYGRGWKGMRISVNGEALPIKEGVAHFEHTFPTTGIYPLQVEARRPNYNPGDDSVAITKTFLLHVTH